MNFLHSMEQRLLKDTVKNAFANVTPARVLTTMADLEVFGLLVPEDRGGSGLGLVEAVIVVEAAAQAGLRLPLSESILLADHVSQDIPDSADMIFKGETLIDVVTSGHLSLEAGRLRGRLTARNIDSLRWLAAPISVNELAIFEADQLAGTPLQAIEIGETALSLDVDADLTSICVLRVAGYRDALALLHCAELLGAATHCFDLSVIYLKDREQFGQPIGANQALKHMAADTLMMLENVRVAVEFAAAALDAARASPEDRELADQAELAVRVMRGYVPGATRQIAETAVQFHGGIGLTWEYELNGYLRHIIRLGMTLGDGSNDRRALLDSLSSGMRADLSPVLDQNGRVGGTRHDCTV